MNQQEPSQNFQDLVDDMTTPRPAPAPALRVAEFHFGAYSVAPAIEAAKMDIVALLDATREIPDFDEMPEFDIVVASAPPDANEWAVTDYVLRFVRVRRPIAFLVLGCTDEKFRTTLAEASRPYEYEISLNRGDVLDFVTRADERVPEGETWEKLREIVWNVWGKEERRDAGDE